MKWLYTCYDGCNGQCVGGTLTNEAAIKLLMKRDEMSEDEATDALADGAKEKQEVRFEDGETVLLPIIEEEYVDDEDDEDDED